MQNPSFLRTQSHGKTSRGWRGRGKTAESPLCKIRTRGKIKWPSVDDVIFVPFARGWIGKVHWIKSTLSLSANDVEWRNTRLQRDKKLRTKSKGDLYRKLSCSIATKNGGEFSTGKSMNASSFPTIRRRSFYDRKAGARQDLVISGYFGPG